MQLSIIIIQLKECEGGLLSLHDVNNDALKRLETAATTAIAE